MSRKITALLLAMLMLPFSAMNTLADENDPDLSINGISFSEDSPTGGDDITITAETGDLLYKKTVNEIIDMKLQQIKIKEYKIAVEEENIDFYEDYYFKSRQLDKNKVYEIVKANNLDINS